jgi:signal peptidase I
MEPTVMPGDTILADMRYYSHNSLSSGSVVILDRPNERGVIVIKRIIATGGDTIRSTDGDIYLNSNAVNEPYVKHIGNALGEMMNFGPITIPAHKLFVMGDNRDVSLDSRMAEFGLVDQSAVLGKALYVFKAANDRNGKPLH